MTHIQTFTAKITTAQSWTEISQISIFTTARLNDDHTRASIDDKPLASVSVSATNYSPRF